MQIQLKCNSKNIICVLIPEYVHYVSFQFSLQGESYIDFPSFSLIAL